ncbi:MAG: hypothetical protein ABW204_02000 [Microbacteriaceae bacterium]
MSKPLRLALIVLGALLALMGAVLTVIFLFQPWRSCPYDDSPAACAMLPGDAAVMSASMIGTVVGICLLAAGLLVRRRDDR